jgi:hypothetical protein
MTGEDAGKLRALQQEFMLIQVSRTAAQRFIENLVKDGSLGMGNISSDLA